MRMSGFSAKDSSRIDSYPEVTREECMRMSGFSFSPLDHFLIKKYIFYVFYFIFLCLSRMSEIRLTLKKMSYEIDFENVDEIDRSWP